MRIPNLPGGAILAWCVVLAAGAARPALPPVAAVVPVTNAYHGTVVVDPYQWLENIRDPQVAEWIRGQNAHTRGVLDRVPARAVLEKRRFLFGQLGMRYR